MNTFWLTNVRLEKGFEFENERIAGTETEICHLKIEDGKIAEITNVFPTTEEKQVDAGKQLLLPSFESVDVLSLRAAIRR